jgi:hypothetical protein
VSQLCNHIAALDKGLAERWKARTHAHAQPQLTPAGVDSILSPLLKTEKKASAKISEKQAEAIVALVRERPDSTRARWTGFDAGSISRKSLWPSTYIPWSARTGSCPLTTPWLALRKFPSQVLEQRLTMPRTITGQSRTSFGVKKKRGVIFQVRMADLFVLTKDDGEYLSDFNRIVVYDKLGNLAFTSTIVPECRHAIQDWLDIAMQRRRSGCVHCRLCHVGHSAFEGDLSDAAFRAVRPGCQSILRAAILTAANG